MATTKDVIRIGERTWTQAEWNRMLAEADRASADEAQRWPQVTAVSYDRALPILRCGVVLVQAMISSIGWPWSMSSRLRPGTSSLRESRPSCLRIVA